MVSNFLGVNYVGSINSISYCLDSINNVSSQPYLFTILSKITLKVFD